MKNNTTLAICLALMTAALTVVGSLSYSFANAVGTGIGNGGVAGFGGLGGSGGLGGVGSNGTNSNGTNANGPHGSSANGGHNQFS